VSEISIVLAMRRASARRRRHQQGAEALGAGAAWTNSLPKSARKLVLLRRQR